MSTTGENVRKKERLHVYLNRLPLKPGTDFTVTVNSEIVFSNAPEKGTEVYVVAFGNDESQSHELVGSAPGGLAMALWAHGRLDWAAG